MRHPTRILRKHGDPPDKPEKATQTVLEQAEVPSQEWAGSETLVRAGRGGPGTDGAGPMDPVCPVCMEPILPGDATTVIDGQLVHLKCVDRGPTPGTDLVHAGAGGLTLLVRRDGRARVDGTTRGTPWPVPGAGFSRREPGLGW